MPTPTSDPDAEYAYLRERGDGAFEALLEERQVDYVDLEREPVVGSSDLSVG